MLSELRLANFRCFDDEVRLRIRPITVLIGKNNAGKSSLIKFLLMLKQSANRSDENYLLPNAEGVELGNLNELKHRTKNRRKPRLQFDLRTKERGSPSGKLYDLARRHLPTVRTEELRNLEHSIQVSVSYKQKLSHGTTEIWSFLNDHPKVYYKSAISTNSVFLQETDSSRENGTEGESQLRLGEECARSIARSLRGVKHLSAARKELPIEISQYRRDMGYVGKEGQDTLFCLWKEGILDDQLKKVFLLRHTKAILNIEDLKIVKAKQYFSVDAHNSETGAKTNIANFGFGVSQCLPIFVQGLMMNPYSQLIVEQPEAQVHPTAQLNLASFFVDLWKKRDVGSIIETHSDNLILRLRHEVARKNLKPEDVSIAYLSLDDSGKKATPIIKNLDIKPDGSLQEGLPMEFFGGDLTEVFNFMKEQAGQDPDE